MLTLDPDPAISCTIPIAGILLPTAGTAVPLIAFSSL